MSEFVDKYLNEVVEIVGKIRRSDIDAVVDVLCKVRSNGGRLFLIGVGGSSANASHAVNDFRKLASIECYCPTDNVSELTARINDDGWAGVFAAWLMASNLSARDGLFILSVGGGDVDKNVSPNLVEAIKLAKAKGASVCGIVGRDGGYTKKLADACVLIPTVDDTLITPHTEAFQAVVLHLIVSHPLIKKSATKWESVQGSGNKLS